MPGLPFWKWLFFFGPGIFFLLATLVYYFRFGREEGDR
jgi:hypothetical protein